MSNDNGILYVVATPIGNLGDITARALEILADVDLVLAEDTRQTRKLLSHYAINATLKSCHEHNEDKILQQIIGQLEQGQRIALVSDAGTPLISDPGYPLTRTAVERGIRVIPLPGPCAAIAALSASGLPSDSFYFAGFAPQRPAARHRFLNEYSTWTATLIFYESPRRITAFLADAVQSFGAGRPACLARELTKVYETLYHDTLINLRDFLEANPDRQRGEFVVLIQGAGKAGPDNTREVIRLMTAMRRQGISLKQAVAVAREVTGGNKRPLYELALELYEKE